MNVSYVATTNCWTGLEQRLRYEALKGEKVIYVYAESAQYPIPAYFLVGSVAIESEEQFRDTILNGSVLQPHYVEYFSKQELRSQPLHISREGYAEHDSDRILRTWQAKGYTVQVDCMGDIRTRQGEMKLTIYAPLSLPINLSEMSSLQEPLYTTYGASIEEVTRNMHEYMQGYIAQKGASLE